jgi:hypothetical protein
MKVPLWNIGVSRDESVIVNDQFTFVSLQTTTKSYHRQTNENCYDHCVIYSKYCMSLCEYEPVVCCVNEAVVFVFDLKWSQMRHFAQKIKTIIHLFILYNDSHQHIL